MYPFDPHVSVWSAAVPGDDVGAGVGDRQERHGVVAVPPLVHDRRLSAEEKRQLVLEYFAVPHGQKQVFADTRHVSRRSIYRWRDQFCGGSLEEGVTPRQRHALSRLDVMEFKRMDLEYQELLRLREQDQQEIERLRKMVDASGKSIEMLHELHEDSESGNISDQPKNVFGH